MYFLIRYFYAFYERMQMAFVISDQFEVNDKTSKLSETVIYSQ